MKVGAMLRGHARRHPEKTAIILGDEILSFGELDAVSDRMANALLDRSVKAGDRVIVYVGNSLPLIELIAAVWKSGAILVPVTTWITGPELAFMVSDCTPVMIIHGPDQTAAVDEALQDAGDVARVFIGDAAAAPKGTETLDALVASGADTPSPVLPAMPDDGMISYTSGTTGRPKGAIITQASMAVQVNLTSINWRIPADPVLLVSTPVAHRTGLSRLVSCYCQGSTVVVLPRFDVEAALDAIGRHKVTVFGGVPTVFRMLLDGLDDNDTRCDSLQFIMATGEAFPVPLKHRLFKRLPNVKLISFYAMTEAGAPAALMHEQQLDKPDSVGRPQPGMDVRLVGEDGVEVAQGEAGEIQVRCGEPGKLILLREYWNRPEANAASFDGHWFKTGDVGRFDEDGFLYLVDRVKDMIVSGGLNIYSKEVEQALETHPAVSQACVVGAPDAEFGECVVAFVVAHEAVEANAVIDHCRTRIASYKKPKHVIFIDELPHNVTGKMIKTDLREQALATLAEMAG
jgi:long-chain acyl-CoA synthetase